jgi:glucose-1-phosphate cytidylyltransferase
VILAGGLGTRLAEETDRVPKPMVEVGGQPLLWHIMKIYATAGLDHFTVALGYKGEVVKDYFVRYGMLSSDITVCTGSGDVAIHGRRTDDWTVDLVDTGLATNTGGRLRRLAAWLPDDNFCLTYGDGVGNVDLEGLIKFHLHHGRAATVTAIRPPSRFGGLVLDCDQVAEFTEKPQLGEGWINGGFMVLRRDVLDRIEGDDTNFEAQVLEQLAAEGQLMAFRHDDYWQSMDTLRDVRTLRGLWDAGRAPWKVWC